MIKSIELPFNRVRFTSDIHFNHKSLSERRGFKTVEEMNNEIIWRWNLTVPTNVTVFILGDVSMSNNVECTLELLNRLNGTLILVRGNHDKPMKKAVLDRFDGVYDLLTVKVELEDEKVGLQRIVCCHYPMLVWDRAHFGAWHFHGHSHGSAQYPNQKAKILDVGMDCHSFAPIGFNYANNIMKNREIVVLDHHKIKQESGV